MDTDQFKSKETLKIEVKKFPLDRRRSLFSPNCD